MRKILILLMLLISSSVLAENYSTVDVGKNLVVRAKPAMDAHYLFMLKGGTPVKKLDTNEEAGFVKIETDDKKVGWTKKSNIVVRADVQSVKDANVQSQYAVPAILSTLQVTKPSPPTQDAEKSAIAPHEAGSATTKNTLVAASPGLGAPISAEPAKISAAQQMNGSPTVLQAPSKQCEDAPAIGAGYLVLIFAALLACSILITAVATRMHLEKKYVLLER